jgi:divalent metal cation (Fe/Co/Zn/Cd) transporter
MKRVNIPRYLNRPKLFWFFEQDEVIIAGVSFLAVLISSTIFLNLPTWLSIMLAVIIPYLILKTYIELSKKQSPGYLQHMLYKKGFLKSSKKEDPFFPYGFEREFVD